MKKRLLLIVLLCLTGIGTLGCQKSYYGKGQPFTMSTDKLLGYSNAEIIMKDLCMPAIL